jgi:hypothetical protein
MGGSGRENRNSIPHSDKYFCSSFGTNPRLSSVNILTFQLSNRGISMRRSLILLVVCLTLTFWSFAQSPTATITGRVIDPTRAVIAGAAVSATNVDTGISRSTTTNDQGLFTIGNLPPGDYRVDVSRSGFRAVVKPGVVLHVQDVIALNFELSVGSTNESVTVDAGAPLINTETASVGTVIDRQFLQNLPLNGRSFNTLLQLTPGVVIAAPPQFGSPAAGQFSIAGQRTNANGFSVDGVSANFGVAATANVGTSGTGSVQAFSAIGGTSSLVSADALQEFRIEVSSFAPEFGRSPGGQVILTTRSGTNAFHGALYEYFRNDVLDANDWFNNQAGKPRVAERHNDFGGTLDGPIWRNRTFFFFSYEGARLRIPQSRIVTVPSEFARTSAPPSLAPFVVAFPRPDDRTIVPGSYTANFTSTSSNRATLNATSLRVDHRLSDRFSVFGRYNYAPSDFISRPGFVNYIQTLPANTQTGTLGATMSLRANMWNSARANFSEETAGTSLALDSFGGAVPIDPALLLGSASPSDSLGSFQVSGTSFLVGLAARNRTRQLNFVDDLALTFGTHQVKIGGDYRALFLNRTPARVSSTILAITVQGLLTTRAASQNTATNLASQILGQAFSLYAQDSWKIVPRLSLTYQYRRYVSRKSRAGRHAAVEHYLS